MSSQLLQTIRREVADLRSRGENPSSDSYVAKYPDQAEGIRELFQQLDSEETIIQATTLDNVRQQELDREESEQPIVLGEAFEESLSTIESAHAMQPISLVPPSRRSATSLPRQFGPYELVSELARGGMGVVYRARQTKLNRLVALKMILSGQLADDDAIRRFYGEAEAAAALDHPGIVPIFEVGCYDDQHFFSMGLVDGVSLSEIIRRDVPSPRESAAIVKSIATAVSYAHSRGVIHRDLKPANVLMDKSGTPRVTDFGLAKRVSGDSDLTASGQIIGTPSYMPPEQASGRIEDIDVRTDVYSIGAILYEMLTGIPPFRGAHPIETIRQVIHDDPVAPRSLCKQLDLDLETICLKCLAKNSSDRYATATDLVEELNRYLGGLPIKARRLGLVSRSVRWCRRRPLQTGLSAALILLVAVLGLYVTTSRNATHEQRVSGLKMAMSDSLQSVDASLDSLEPAIAIVDQLRQHDPSQADQAMDNLVADYARKVEQRIDVQAIQGDGALVTESIEWIRRHDRQVADNLDQALQRRRSLWRDVADVDGESSVDDLDGLFGRYSIRPKNGRLIRQNTGKAEIPLSIPCSTMAELEATFAESLPTTSAVGLRIGVDGKRGYTFQLRMLPQVDGEPQDIADISPPFQLEIAKSGQTLASRRVSSGVLAQSQWTIVARRERGQLSVQVNDDPPLEIVDVFATMGSQAGRFELIWPSDATLVRLRARTRSLPEQPRPIEQADVLVDQGNWPGALRIYDQLASTSTGSDRAEASYKAAVVLLRMKRIDESVTRLQMASQEGIEPWRRLSVCQQWLVHLQRNEMDSADRLQETLMLAYPSQQLLGSLTDDLRQSILAAYFKDGFDGSSEVGYRRIRQAMSLDQLLSSDGRGTIVNQIQCVKAIELAGRLDDAVESLNVLADQFPDDGWPPYRLSMLLRTRGQASEALRCVDDAIARFDQRQTNAVPHSLWLERTRTLGDMGRFSDALVQLDELAQILPTDPYLQREVLTRLALQSHEALIRGFILDDLGSGDQAEAVWRAGYLLTRQAIGQNDPLEGWLAVNVLILGSLSGELKSEDIPGLVVKLSGKSLPEQLVKVGLASLGDGVVHQALLRMWQRPEGRQTARDGFAFHKISYQQRLNLPIQLAGREMVRQNAFGDELQDWQTDLLNEAVDELIRLVRGGQMGMIDLMGFAMAWNKPGDNAGRMEPILDRLPAKSRGLAAYMVAHRLALLGRPAPVIKKWLGKASTGLADNSETASHIQQELEQLETGQGSLLIRQELWRDLAVKLTGPDGSVQTHQVRQDTALPLPAGTYQVGVPDHPDIVVSPSEISVQPIKASSVNLTSPLAIGPAELSWPGPVIRPAKMAGFQRWQMFCRDPKASIHAIDSSPDGKRIAIASNDGCVRIYRVGDGDLEHILPGHAEGVKDLRWSHDGQYLVTCGWDQVTQLWHFPLAQLVARVTTSSGNLVCGFMPDGMHFYVTTWRDEIQSWSLDGTPAETYKLPAPRCLALDWLSDDQSFAMTTKDGRLVTWSIADPSKHRELDLGEPALLAVSNDRKRLVVWHSRGAELILFEVQDGHVTETARKTLASIRHVSWGPDGQELFLTMDDGRIKILQADDSLEDLVSQPGKYHSFVGTESVEGDRIVAFGNAGQVEVLDADLESVLSVIPPGKGSLVPAWNPDGKFVSLTSGSNRLLNLAADGAMATPAVNVPALSALQWNPSGTMLAGAAWNGDVMVYYRNGGHVKNLQRQSAPIRMNWNDNQSILTASGRGELLAYPSIDQAPHVLATLDRPCKSIIALDQDRALVLQEDLAVVLVQAKSTPKVSRIEQWSGTEQICWNLNKGLIAAARGNMIEIVPLDALISAVDSQSKFQSTSMQVILSNDDAIRDIAWSNDGQKIYLLSRNKKFLVLDSDGNPQSEMNFRPWISPIEFSVNDRDGLLVATSSSSYAFFYDLKQQQSRFTLVVLPSDRIIKILPGGLVELDQDQDGEVDWAFVDEQMVCVAMDAGGSISMHRPSGFLKRE